jgi:penicillin-binding protein-related factor A (putative recombinase)
MNRSTLGRISQSKGDLGETIARRALDQFGVKMIEKVNTPWKVLWKNGRPISAFVVEKVSGDFIGIVPGGKKVLAEVKYRDEKLSLSDFEDHQIEALNENYELGAISLVVWVRRHECAIYWWQAMNLKKGAPIKPGEKTGLQLTIPF